MGKDEDELMLGIEKAGLGIDLVEHETPPFFTLFFKSMNKKSKQHTKYNYNNN